MKKRMFSSRILVPLLAVALLFGGLLPSITKAQAATYTGVTKWTKKGWTAGGYKYVLYLSHDSTVKMEKNYQTISSVLNDVSGLPQPMVKIITKPLAFAFHYEIPSIKKADHGRGIYIPITITWILIPYVQGYYPQ